jgi:hypothetical protein
MTIPQRLLLNFPDTIGGNRSSCPTPAIHGRA